MIKFFAGKDICIAMPLSKLAMVRRWAILLLICSVTACTSLPAQGNRTPSYSILDTADTPLGKAIAPALATHPGHSGVHPLSGGVEAFVARLGLVRNAQRSIDLQYYIYHADSTGLLLLNELMAAADRGVRVRILLDDLHSKDTDEVIRKVDSHANIEVRMFNPFVNRKMRWLDFMSDFSRLNRRMHNKSLTVDGQMTVVGGRNIGDEYFAIKPDLDFSDLDVIAAGPVVAEVSQMFDDYWNSEFSYPLITLDHDPVSTTEEQRQLRRDLDKYSEALRETEYADVVKKVNFAQEVSAGRVQFFWGKGHVISDPPYKVSQAPDKISAYTDKELIQYLDQAKNELILISPYFVPGQKGMEWLKSMAQRGVRVKILTNSLAATDVKAVHAGYSVYRMKLLKEGVELYEFKPTAKPEKKRKGGSHLTGSSRASLHTKAYLVDQREVFIGSTNLDPRSVELNTEMGVIVSSSALSKLWRDNFDRRILDMAYRLELVEERGVHKLKWVTRENGKEVQFGSEPNIGFFQRIGQTLLRMLPVENQL